MRLRAKRCEDVAPFRPFDHGTGLSADGRRHRPAESECKDANGQDS